MSSLWKIALGYNNVGGLQDMMLTPDTDGIAYPRSFPAVSSMVYDDGQLFIDLHPPQLSLPQDWLNFMNQCGLPFGTKSCRVTVGIPEENKLTSKNYNGIIVRPEYGNGVSFEFYWYNNPTMRIRKLKAI